MKVVFVGCKNKLFKLIDRAKDINTKVVKEGCESHLCSVYDQSIFCYLAKITSYRPNQSTDQNRIYPPTFLKNYL
jgi:hypothetical protein